MKARFTKKAFNDIFNYLRDDGDFMNDLREKLNEQ